MTLLMQMYPNSFVLQTSVSAAIFVQHDGQIDGEIKCSPMEDMSSQFNKTEPQTFQRWRYSHSVTILSEDISNDKNHSSIATRLSRKKYRNFSLNEARSFSATIQRNLTELRIRKFFSAHKLNKSSFFIDWNEQTVEQIDRLYRALSELVRKWKQPFHSLNCSSFEGKSSDVVSKRTGSTEKTDFDQRWKTNQNSKSTRRASWTSRFQ